MLCADWGWVVFCLNWSQCHGLINYPYNTKWSERHCPFRLRTHPWACFIDGQCYLRIFDFTRQRRFCVQASQFQKERLCVFKCSFTTVQCLNVRFLSLNVQVLSAISARRRLNIVGMNIDVFWCHNWITLNTKHHWRWTPPTPPSSHLPVVESVNLDSVVSPPHWALL